MSNSKILANVKSVAAVAAGNVLYALTVTLFLLPAGLVTGGTTGIALAVEHFTGLSIVSFVYVFNFIMLAAGLLVLGKRFAMTTVISTFMYPAALDIFERLLDGYVITDDIFICTVFSGLGIGISLGIVIRSGASTGGMDIPPLILKKTAGISVPVSMYFFDVCILLSQAIFRPAENILYGIVLVMIYTIVLDRVLISGASRIELKVISSRSEEIRKAILEKMDRGVTMLDGEGGYLRDEKQIVLSVISGRELAKTEKLIHSIDEESFIIISRVKEVRGRGFSTGKIYR